MLISKLDLDLTDDLQSKLFRFISVNVSPKKKERVIEPRLGILKHYDVIDIRKAIDIKYKSAEYNNRWIKYIPRWEQFLEIIKGIEDDRTRNG